MKDGFAVNKIALRRPQVQRRRKRPRQAKQHLPATAPGRWERMAGYVGRIDPRDIDTVQQAVDELREATIEPLA